MRRQHPYKAPYKKDLCRDPINQFLSPYNLVWTMPWDLQDVSETRIAQG